MGGLAENIISGKALLTIGEAWHSTGKNPQGLDTRDQRTPPATQSSSNQVLGARQRSRAAISGQQAKPPRTRDITGADQLSTLLARQAAFEARIETAVARLSDNLTEVSDALGTGRHRSRSQPPAEHDARGPL